MVIYHARWLAPVIRPPIERGWIAVEDGRISRVGAPEEFKVLEFRNHEVRDLGECLILPGFVNAHTHLELTCYRDRLAPGPLWPWLDRLIALRSEAGAGAREREAVRTGAAESLAAGVTCVGDISRTGLNLDGLKASPIRKVCYLELISGATQPPHDARSLAETFGRLQPCAEPNHLIPGLTPHSPYMVTPDDLAAAVRLARDHVAPLTLHLLETRDEARWLRDRTGAVADFLDRCRLPNAKLHPGAETLDLIERAGLLSASALFVHVNYVTDEEIARLASAGAAVVWCPRAHRFFGHAAHRWREMMAAGINVSIGTDSAASQGGLSILEELRWLQREAPEASPARLVEMGTLRAAAGLGLNRVIGSLERGKLADFVSIPLDPDGPSDPLRNLLEGRTAVSGVWIDGSPVWASRR